MEPVMTDLAERAAIPHTAVVIIDMQNAFCAEGDTSTSGVNKSAIRSMVPRLQDFVNHAREMKVPLIFVRSVMDEKDFSPPIRELCIRNYGREVAFCLRGAWETEFIPEIQPAENDRVIEKTRYSAFARTDLDKRLRDLGIKTLVMTGVGTDVCVETTCRDGFMRDYYIIVPDDLVATTDDNFHRSALAHLKRYFATVTSSKELLRLWGGSRSE